MNAQPETSDMNKELGEGFSTPRTRSIESARRRFFGEKRRPDILKVAEEQFVANGLGATTAGVAKAARISEAVLQTHFGTKQKLFQEAVKRNSQVRIGALRERFISIPNLPLLECIESMAESTVLACVDDKGNASVMARALMEMPEFAADVYRDEIGATEALWNAEIATRFADSPLRNRIAVHLVPYSAHACMAFGFWLTTLRHKAATAQAHARQYADAVAQFAWAILNIPSDSPEAAVPRKTA